MTGFSPKGPPPRRGVPRYWVQRLHQATRIIGGEPPKNPRHGNGRNALPDARRRGSVSSLLSPPLHVRDMFPFPGFLATAPPRSNFATTTVRRKRTGENDHDARIVFRCQLTRQIFKRQNLTLSIL